MLKLSLNKLEQKWDTLKAKKTCLKIKCSHCIRVNDHEDHDFGLTNMNKTIREIRKKMW